MSIDNVLSSSGLDMDAILGELCYLVSEIYFNEEETITNTFYQPETDNPYFLIDTMDYFIKESNLVPAKTQEVDIDWDQEISHPISNEFDEKEITDRVRYFGWHGGDMLVGINDSPKVTINAIIKRKVPSNLGCDIELALKQLWYYLYLGDTNNVYQTLRVISSAKNNYRAKNKYRPIYNMQSTKLETTGSLRYAK